MKIIGILQLITAFSRGTGGTDFLSGVIIGGFMNFAFGLPIFLSFKKGDFYSGEDYQVKSVEVWRTARYHEKDIVIVCIVLLKY